MNQNQAFWTPLDKLFEEHYPVNKGRLDGMYVREDWKPVEVSIKGESAPTTAILWKVVNKNPSQQKMATLHYVLLAWSSSLQRLIMWCFDPSVAKKEGVVEDACHYWREVAKLQKKGEEKGFMCKHIVFVYKPLQNAKLRKEIEEVLCIKHATEVPADDTIKTALGHMMNAFYYGPTGSGKTHLVRTGLRHYPDYAVYRLHVTNGLEDVDVLQKLIPTSDGKGWTRTVGELRSAFDAAREGKVVVLLEELMRSSKSLRNLLIKCMDNEEGFFTLHDITTGEHIRVPSKNMVFIATANLGGADVSELDPALAGRFPLFLFRDYDSKMEQQLLVKKVGTAVAAKMCAIVKKQRDLYRSAALPMPLDTRSILLWGDLVNLGYDLYKAASLTWVQRIVEKEGGGYPVEEQLAVIQSLFQ